MTEKTSAGSSSAKTTQTLEAHAGALEKWLEDVNKKLPQIPARGKEVLAKITPWLALIGGILTLLGSWSFWQTGQYMDQYTNVLNQWSTVTGQALTTPTLGLTWYLLLVVMVVEAVVLLVAFPRLKDGKRSGWKLLFYLAILSLVLGILYIFTPGYGGGSFIGTLIGSAIGFYLLMQIRPHFTK